MKLTKLPKLKRPKKGGGGGDRLPSTLPKMKKSNLPALPDEVLDNEVEASASNFDERKGAGIDPTQQGRWFETGRANGSIGARCGKCGRLRKAENLTLQTLPFGQGEVWACKGSCR